MDEPIFKEMDNLRKHTDEPIPKEKVSNSNDTNTQKRPSRRAKSAAVVVMMLMSMSLLSDVVNCIVVFYR